MSTSIRGLARSILPPTVRRGLASALHYGQRIGRWPWILRDVRGADAESSRALWQSAAASPLEALRSLGEWQDPILIADAVVEVQGIGRFSLRARCDDLWHVVPWREREVLDAFRRYLRPGDVFVDAGANIGVYTVFAASAVGVNGTVVAVEMMPDTADRLERHVAENALSNVRVERVALTDEPHQTLIATVDEGKYGQARLGATLGRVERTTHQVAVTTSTLDVVTADLSRVRMLKMDLEGAEEAALRGARALLRKTDFVVYEQLPDERDDAVSTCLRDAGFSLTRLDGRNWLGSRST